MDIPEELIENYDLTVDFIITPKRTIKTECKHPRPQGIIWSKLDKEVLKKIPILKKLRKIEEDAGKDVVLKTQPAQEDEYKKSKIKKRPTCHPKADLQCEHLASEGVKCVEGEKCKFPKVPVTTVYLSDIPSGLRVSELKSLLREHEAVPLRITWHGARHRAFLLYADDTSAEHALIIIQKLSLNGHTIHIDCVRSQWP